MKEDFAGNFFGYGPEDPAPREPVCNPTTRYCIFSLDTTTAAAQNPRNFSVAFQSRGTGSVQRFLAGTHGEPKTFTVGGSP
jgi:hypothetical protein